MQKEIHFEADSVGDLLKTATNLELLSGLRVLIRMSNFNRVKVSGSGETLLVKDLQEALIKQLEENLSQTLKQEPSGLTLFGICPKCYMALEDTVVTTPEVSMVSMFARVGSTYAKCSRCGFDHVRMDVKN